MMITMNRALERGLVSATTEVCTSLLEKMQAAGQLTCSVDEGLRHLDGLGTTTARAAAKKKDGDKDVGTLKPGVPLPF